MEIRKLFIKKESQQSLFYKNGDRKDLNSIEWIKFTIKINGMINDKLTGNQDSTGSNF